MLGSLLRAGPVVGRPARWESEFGGAGDRWPRDWAGPRAKTGWTRRLRKAIGRWTLAWSVLLAGAGGTRLGTAPVWASAPAGGAAAGELQGAAAKAVTAATPKPQYQKEREASGEGGDVVYQLRHISTRDLAAEVTRILGRSDSVTTTPDGKEATARLPSAPNVEASMRIERQTGRVVLHGPAPLTQLWLKVLQALDRPGQAADRRTEVLRVQRADPRTIQRAVSLLGGRSSADSAKKSSTAAHLLEPAAHGSGAASFVTKIFQTRAGAPAPAPAASGAPPTGTPGLLGEVQIEYIAELGIIIVRGRPDDVKRVEDLIAEIERQSAVTRPEISVYPLQHVNSQALTDLITPIYQQVFEPRQGPLSITALVKPNALLLVGRSESLEAVRELIEKLDQPVAPEAKVRVFPLKFMSAVDAEARISGFFTDTSGLNTRVRAVSDPRSNSLIVEADDRDMEQVERLIEQLDVETIEATTLMRVFPLKNTLAEDLQAVLEDAIGRQAAAAAAQQQQATLPSTRVQILGVDDRGNRIIESGVLSDVSVTADLNLNALIVRAPAKSMELVAELIRQLDQTPSAEALIKVFQIEYGDATNLAAMLQQLFGQQVTVGTQGAINTFGSAFGFGQAAAQTAAAGGESSLVPLRFAVDQRTNCIIASGSRGDLAVVETILVRLDEGDLRRRETRVYRLNNASAQSVAQALTDILTRQTQLLQQQQSTQFALISPSEFIDQQIFVVPELITNSLIVSATPDYYEQISNVIADLDRRPPMVFVQVIMAELDLNYDAELGVELGLQDSLLFNRGLPENSPGFSFLGQRPGNSNSAESLSTRENLAGQAITSFLVGTSSAASGFPGMVLSASNESVNILIRALQQRLHVQILSRPTIMALNNYPASVLVGERVPQITDFQTTTTGTVNSVDLVDTGLSLGVIPRVTPDGLIVMDLEITKSEVGSASEGIPIGISDGQVINSPKFKDTTAVTTISARSGQTVVFAGLISTEKSHVQRGVPYLMDVPVLGRLFRFDVDRDDRKELLIFLTPHLVDDEGDMDWLKTTESERMSWCLADVMELAGDVGMSSRGGGYVGGAPVIYPDRNPTAAELVSPPGAAPGAARPEERPFLVPPDQLKPSPPYLTPPEQQPESRPYIEPAAPPPDAGAGRWTRPQPLAVLAPENTRPMGPPAPPRPAQTAAAPKRLPAAIDGGPPARPPGAVSPVRYQTRTPEGIERPRRGVEPARLPAAR